VNLSWQVRPDRQTELLWQERGGPAVSAPTRRGFGTLMLEQGLVSELQGAVVLDFNPDGLVCRIATPIEETN
jgi:two-component sensor histidine kinase